MHCFPTSRCSLFCCYLAVTAGAFMPGCCSADEADTVLWRTDTGSDWNSLFCCSAKHHATSRLFLDVTGFTYNPRW